MIVIQRRTPKLFKGFKVILEDGTSEKVERCRCNGFNIVDDDDEVDLVENDDEIIGETETREAGDDVLSNIPKKRMKLM